MQPPVFSNQCKVLSLRFVRAGIEPFKFGVQTAHLYVLIRNFIVRPEVSGSTTGGCGPPTIREEGKGDVIDLVSGLDVTSGSQRCHSQEGMPHSVTDVCYGFHVHTVVMQWFRVHCRTRFCQEDTEPPAEILWAARLNGRNPNFVFRNTFCCVAHSTTPTLTLIKGRPAVWRFQSLSSIPFQQIERQLLEIIPVLPPEQPFLCCSVGFWRQKDVWVPDLEPLHSHGGEVRARRSERLLYHGRNAEHLDTSSTTAPATFDSPAKTGSLQK